MQNTTIIDEQNQNKSELGNLGIKDVFFKYIRFLPLFILSVAFALFGAYIYLRYATPVYTASGTLRVKDEKTSNGGDDRLNQLLVGDNQKNIQNEIEVLKSRPLMARVVNALDLQANYFAVGKIKSPNIYGQCPFSLQIAQLNDSSRSFSLHIKVLNDNQFTLSGDKDTHQFGQNFTTGYGTFSLVKNGGALGREYIVNWEPTMQIAAVYAGALQVAPKPNTGILNLTLESTNPQLSADIINQLMLEYGEMTREEKNEQAQLTLHYINLELGAIQHQIDSIQKIKVNFEIQNNLFDEEAQSQNYFQDLTESDKAIFEQSLQMNIAGLIENYISDSRNEFNAVPSSLSINDATLSALVMDYNKNQALRRQFIDAKVPASNDWVKDLEAKIRQGRQNILEATKNIKSSIGVALAKQRQKSGVAQGQLQAMPNKVKEHADILTQLQSKMGLYKFLNEKKEETAISLAAAIPSSKLIDSAYPNYTPIKPNRRAIQILAIVIGMGLPTLVIFILEVVNDKITTRYDIEKITQAPVLGEVGHSFSESTLVVSRNNRSMVAEQFRIIRSNLQYILNKIDKPVILVTSSFSGEGKSFISTNLGSVMALAGKKTIVLEFDIRKPKIMKGLGLPKGPGITNFLLGKVTKEELARPVPDQENLYVLSCGPVPPNPSELLLDSKMDELFSYLKDNFDVVLIDTAPVGMVSDAMTLGKFANCTLYIVRQGHTYKKQIGLIDEFYREAKLPKVSIIINDVKVKPGYGYYGYGRYGYGYGSAYGSTYYEEEKRPRTFFRRVFGWASSNGVSDKAGEKQKQS